MLPLCECEFSDPLPPHSWAQALPDLYVLLAGFETNQLMALSRTNYADTLGWPAGKRSVSPIFYTSVLKT